MGEKKFESLVAFQCTGPDGKKDLSKPAGVTIEIWSEPQFQSLPHYTKLIHCKHRNGDTLGDCCYAFSKRIPKKCTYI